ALRRARPRSGADVASEHVGEQRRERLTKRGAVRGGRSAGSIASLRDAVQQWTWEARREYPLLAAERVYVSVGGTRLRYTTTVRLDVCRGIAMARRRLQVVEDAWRADDRRR